MSADLALQKALRAVLVNSVGVVALVPADAILDRNARPAPSLSIVLGESQELDSDEPVAGDQVLIYHTVHIWKEEVSLEGVKRIGHAVRVALRAGRVVLDNGYHLARWRVFTARYFRDPNGKSSHGVLTIAARIGGGDL